jgi:16S rRNA (adenine1518-N6/adenine1519-N6)-dimethyltransferase
VRPRKRFGQHFLVSDWAQKVVEAIAPQPADRFVEIGPGPGALTLRLAPKVSQVTAIEIDRDLAGDLRRIVPPNVDVVTGDILQADLTGYATGGPLRIAGNLPYNISTPILFMLLAAGKHGQPAPPGAHAWPPFLDAALMLQREVADRLAASTGTKDYGVLTILTAAGADVTPLLTLPPGAFRPAPKVHSALVRLTFVPSRVPAGLTSMFERLVRVLFMQRRKTVGNALRPFAAEAGVDPARALEAAAIDPRLRPENLDLESLLRLAACVSSLKSEA